MSTETEAEPTGVTPVGAKPEKKWRVILSGEWGRILAAGLLGVAGTILGTWWFQKVPRLYYTAGDIVAFKGEKTTSGIINLNVENVGNKMAEKIVCSLPLNGAKIQDFKITPHHLKGTMAVDSDYMTINVESLNATEKFQITALTGNPEKLSVQPEWNVRAADVVGVKKSTSGPMAGNFVLALGMSLMVVGITSLFGWGMNRDFVMEARKSRVSHEQYMKTIDTALDTMRIQREVIENLEGMYESRAGSLEKMSEALQRRGEVIDTQKETIMKLELFLAQMTERLEILDAGKSSGQ